MNVTLNKQDELNSVIKIQLTPEDYKPKVDAELKKVHRTISLPGFRPGKSPFEVVRKRFGADERQSPEWTAHFDDTLRLVEGWKESEENSPEDWFGMVSEAYELLAEKPPAGKARDAAMSRYLNFMETHYASVANHNLWFTQLKSQWKSKDPWIVDQMINSRNPVISLYVKVHKRIDP